jgi:hypothetical protein
MKVTIISLISICAGWFLNNVAEAIDTKTDWRDPARWAMAALVEIAVLSWLL